MHAKTYLHIKLALVLPNHEASFAMENHQLSQQRSERESRREYKSPTLRKLGKLTHMTLQVGSLGAMDAPTGATKTH